ncbi:MAG: RNA polymerase sporulation sigma factor SigH [Thermoleophilia bacterium]|nr:RNA polymerase sporulation sigma factor SigH [Thermoleophilia bacterium]
MGLTERAGYPVNWDDEEELVRLAKLGDAGAIKHVLAKYRHFVRIKATSYFIAGGDTEDLIQEGYIGLYKAIRDYRSERASCFRSFAELCVTRQIITAIKTASRQKHAPLNSYVSFSYSSTRTGTEERTLADLIPSGRTSDPVQQVISSEELGSLLGCLQRLLSPLETRVLRHYLEGLSYEDIAEIIDHDTKTVDNALQRIKRKVNLHLESRRVV